MEKVRRRFSGENVMRQRPLARKPRQFGLRQTRAQVRGALQMVERGRPILREAVPFRRFDRHVVGGIGRWRGTRFLFHAQILPHISHRSRCIKALIGNGEVKPPHGSRPFSDPVPHLSPPPSVHSRSSTQTPLAQRGTTPAMAARPSGCASSVPRGKAPRHGPAQLPPRANELAPLILLQYLQQEHFEGAETKTTLVPAP